jgi:choline dehydrogenase-like flavoprotein
VHGIEIGRDGNVAAIRYKHADGSDHRTTARVYVLVAHAIEIPKLLLMSRGPNAPKGVANSSDQVGRNLMDHPIQLSWALTGSPVYPYRGPSSTSGVENSRGGDWRAMRPAFRIEIGNRRLVVAHRGAGERRTSACRVGPARRGAAESAV